MFANNSLTQLTQEFKQQFGLQLNGRVDRAASLVAGGHVVETGPGEWQVISTNHESEYTVSFGLAWSCDCPDCQGTGHHPAPILPFCGGVQPVCKHILAACMAWLIGPDELNLLPIDYDEYIAQFRRQQPQALADEPDRYLADFGLTDEQLATTPPAYLEMLDREHARITALPAWVDDKASIEEWLG